MSHSYKYPRPMVTVDAVIFKKDESTLSVLLIKRLHDPYKNTWALPGGFVDMNETLDQAVARELKEETGLSEIELTQMYAFGDPGRDPRGRNISIVYYGILEKEKPIKAGDDAREAQWFDIENLPKLGFDHDKIIEMATTLIFANNACRLV